jgi:hypothetical protein
MQHAADLVLDGKLFGLWVTADTRCAGVPDRRLRAARYEGALLRRSNVRHALITSRLPDDAGRMVLIGPVPSRNADPSGWVMQGMRAARNGRISFDGIGVAASALIGSDGDYLRVPDFSAGAWRGAAVALGGLERLWRRFARRSLIATGPRTPNSEPALAKR